jgi:hypothetical protein
VIEPIRRGVWFARDEFGYDSVSVFISVQIDSYRGISNRPTSGSPSRGYPITSAVVNSNTDDIGGARKIVSLFIVCVEYL